MSSGVNSLDKRMGTVQAADPRAKRNAIWVICVATLLGVSAILAFDYYRDDLQYWLEKNIDYLLENTIIVFLLTLLLVSPILAAGTYFLLVGNRTVHARRFPPPGYSVYRETPVLEGQRGVRRGRIIQIISLILLCAAGTIPVIMWQLFRSLGRN